ncbi:penicillin-binding protein 2 [Effusibacillus lacus]|uniref:Penicillin-binding protein 2 n=1 Tax=Effusibacillus lacus TaxID=1348429 RepID=A0A292YNY7_9BACL|nr:penicillin-binding protein 2 [Effusibacillus lacus]TCS70623.1 penicillin-binding protein 2 [Effusibacillus lacus]GAX90621.1 penicillin-binding protein 2 [Effusibacillus lacus]
MEKETQSHLSGRLHILFFIVFLGLVMLLLRLSYIQLQNGDKYEELAEGNRYAQQVLPAPRGQFIDRNGEILVTNKPSFTIQYTNPFTAKDEKEKKEIEKQIELIAERLLPLLEDPEDKEKLTKEKMISIMRDIKPNMSRSTPRKIKTNATDRQVARIREHLHELPGIAVIPEAIRDYRLKTFGSHIFGYMNSINDKMWNELGYKNKGYLMTDKVGYTGLEKQYEEYLKGTHGATRVEVNIHGDPIRRDKNSYFVEKKPIPGNDLILTIDRKLQQATEEALAERVNALKGSTVKNAAAVAMDPNTGEVLALASYPAFDPNHWLDYLSDEEEKLFRPAEWNHAVEYPYEPGSTVKMLTTMIGLKEGVVKPDEKIFCPGGLDLSGYYAKCWDDRGHGYSNGREAIAKSCNVYMYTIGKRLGKHQFIFQNGGVKNWMEKYDKPAFEKFKKYQNEFGLGVKTGIDLPFESAGKYNYFELATTNMPFFAIGQNSNFTTLQLAQYVSTIANGGKRLKPYLVQRIVSPEKKVIKEMKPEVLNQVSFSPELLQYAREGMWQVTHEPYGTASYTFGKKPYNVAGKTGTAQTGRNTENYWFVGFAPYENPKIAIAVVVPEGKVGAHSYEMAGPIAEKMLDTFFGVPPKEEKKPQ